MQANPEVKVPFLDLRAANMPSEHACLDAMTRVVKSGWFVRGQEVIEFEKEFADFSGATACVGVGNGLDALTLVLNAWKTLGLLADGDEVLVPANTYIASVLSILNANLKPVLVDPDAVSWLLTPECCHAHLSAKTKVIMPVHLYGIPADMSALSSFARDRNLLILDDCAQSHGAEVNHKSTCFYADASAYSFYPGKNLGAYGDAGAVISNNTSLCEIVRKLGNYGSARKYYNDLQGVNSRLDEIQAAILRVKLKTLKSDTLKRNEIATVYDETVTAHRNVYTRPKIAKHLSPVNHLYPILVKDRESFMEFLHRRGIDTLIHYPVPPHRQECLLDKKYGDFPITDYLSRSIVSIPLYPNMPHEHIEHVINALSDYGEMRTC